MHPSFDISIVIPVFNCETYLENCICSILKQDGVALEVIFVNDGSTDKSAEIIEKYACSRDNFRLLHQENSGAAAARNHGMKYAQGKYTLFVDADDALVDGSLKDIFREAEKDDADILHLTHYICRKGEERRKVSIYPVDEATDGIAYFKTMQRKRCLIAAPFNFLLRTDFISSLPFRFDTRLIRCQDLEFFIKAMLMAKKIRNYPVPYYLYNVGTDTGGKKTRNNTAILFDCYRAILESFRTFADTMGLGCEMRKRLDYHICSHIYGYGTEVFKSLNESDRAFWISFIKNNMFRNYGWMRPWIYIKYWRLSNL